MWEREVCVIVIPLNAQQGRVERGKGPPSLGETAAEWEKGGSLAASLRSERERGGGQPVEPLFLKRFFSFHLWDFHPSHVAVLGKRQRGEKIGEGRFFLSLLLHIWFLLSPEFSLQSFFPPPPPFAVGLCCVFLSIFFLLLYMSLSHAS